MDKTYQNIAQELRRISTRLAYLLDEGEYSHIDKFQKVTTWIADACRQLIAYGGGSPEEEAEICLSVLMGYSATVPDARIIQVALGRAERILPLLTPSLLKCQLLTYCYAEVYDDDLAVQAHYIINSWRSRKLNQEEQRIKDLLEDLERFV